MEKLKYVLIALLLSPLFIAQVGCSDDEVPPTPPADTTTTEIDTPRVGFTVSFQNYQLVLDDNQSSASYRKDLDQTEIVAVGYSTKGESGASITSKAEIELVFGGKTTGLYTENSTDFSFEIATGEGAKRVESSSDNTTPCAVTVTEYGEVGEKIKGTFTADLKSGISSRTFSKGFFDMVRDSDR